MTYKYCPGACGRTLVPALATAPGHGQRQRPDLDLPHQVRGQVPGRHPGHLPGRQVRGRAHLRPRRAVQRPELLLEPAGRERGKTYPGPYKDQAKDLMGLTAIDTPDATTVVFHLAQPFSDFDYAGCDPADRPGAAGQGHRRQLPDAHRFHRPVQVPELPAEQDGGPGPEHALERLDDPDGLAAGQQDRRQHEHEPQRRGQPAAGR